MEIFSALRGWRKRRQTATAQWSRHSDVRYKNWPLCFLKLAQMAVQTWQLWLSLARPLISKLVAYWMMPSRIIAKSSKVA